ncbi:MAG: hypothetical protein QOE71_4043 [Pseudonocardiales bacterium]|jgi:hypothetical protein|nr:hypothetical protein [Pseudonocardiales bacterium]
MSENNDNGEPVTVDPEEIEDERTDVGGPGSALGSGVEHALTGNDPGSSEEDRSGSTSNPS